MSYKTVCDRCGKIIEDTYYDYVHLNVTWDEKDVAYYYAGQSLKFDFCKKCFSELREHNWFIDFN